MRSRMRSRFFSLAATLVTVACVPDSAGPPATKAPDLADARGAAAASASAPTDAAAVEKVAIREAGAARTPVPEGPAKWRTVPRADNGFYAVLDGLCSQLEASRVGSDIVVHYGGGGNTIYLTNGMRRGQASFIALRDDGLEYIGDPGIMSPMGVAGSSLDNFWVADSTGSRSSEGAMLHRYVGGGTWKKYEKDQTNLHAWVDGGIIGSLGFAAANGDLWVEGSSTKPPASLYGDMPFPSLAAFPTGDVLIAARKGDLGNRGPFVARHWAPGKKTSEHALAPFFSAETTWVRFVEIAPDEIYAVDADRAVRWDGSSFKALAKTIKGEPIRVVRRVAADDLWVLTDPGTLQRLASSSAGGASVIATPEPLADFDGTGASAWIVGKSGKLYRRDGEAWKNVPLPAPPFSAGGAVKAKRIVVISPDDVLLTTMNWEKALAWKDQELHTTLFRTKSVKETLRCNEPDPESNNVNIGRGFQSWPPVATAECKTPFAVLARRSNANKVVDDWPRIRAALKGHTELGELSLLEIVSGDRTFVGVKAKDLEWAKSVIGIVAKNDRLRPEIVCGEPDAKRTIAIDLATGAAQPTK